MSDAALAEWIDAEADRFEALWRAGKVPDISQFLVDVPPDRRSRLAVELVQIDRAYRAQLGDARTWNEYRPEFPDLPAEPQSSTVVPLWPQIPGFEIVGLLGSDGMGVVYRAKQLQPPRQVALKMMRGPADAELLARFRQEIEAVARLQHANIVQIYACGEHAGQPYMALELVEGGNLAERAHGQPQPERAAARLIESLARAMEFVHAQGIVHRDLKPGNILVAGPRDAPLEKCDAKITDFGLAKFLDRDGGPSQTGSALGSPSYMAPEQASGRARDVTPAADVYGLGAILYALLTGRPPFLGSSILDTLDQVARLEPVSPRRLRPNLPRDLETVCLKCLRKDPAARYPSAGELADDLHRFIDGKPVVARPVSFIERGWRTVRRYPVVSGLSLAFMFTLIMGTVVSTLFAIHSRQQERIASDKTKLAERKAEEARANQYVADMQLLDIDWNRGNLNRMRDVLARYAHPTPEAPDLRGWEWYFNERRILSPLRTIPGVHASHGRQIAVSPDGKWIITNESSTDTTVRVLDGWDFREIRRWKAHDTTITAIAFCPNGTDVATGTRSGEIRIWNLHSGKCLATLPGNGKYCSSIIVLPEGRRVISQSDRGELSMWRLDSVRLAAALLVGDAPSLCALAPDGRRIAQIHGKKLVMIAVTDDRLYVERELPVNHEITCVTFAPDGKSAAYGCRDGTVEIRSLSAADPVKVFAGLRTGVQAITLSPDGRSLVTASSDLTIRIWSVESQLEVHRFRGHVDSIGKIVWTADRLRIFTGCSITKINTWAPAGVPDVRRVECGFGLYSSAYDPKGTLLAVGGESSDVLVLDALTGRTMRRLPGHEPSVMGVAFDSTGQTLATADRNGNVRLWDVTSGKLRRTLSAQQGKADAVAFSPDGSILATSGVDRVIRFWNPDNGERLAELHGHSDRVHGLHFNHNGSLLVSACDDYTVRLWDVAARAPRAVLPGHTNWVYAAVFSPDGRLVASTSHDQTVRIWNVESATEAAVLPGHQGWTWSVAFSPDGRRLATASGDELIKLWDMTTLQEIQSLDEHVGRPTLPGADPPRPYTMAMSPDGHTIASGGSDGHLVIRHAKPWSDDVALEREAMAVIDVLVEEKQSEQEIQSSLATLHISKPVRERALALLPRYFPRQE